MTAHIKSFALFSVFASASGGMAVAQAVAPVAISSQPQAVAPATAAPALVAPAPAAVPLPPPLWSIADAQVLLGYIQQLDADGLNPANYNPAGLAAAIQSRDAGLISQAANDRFQRVASDLALGYVPRKERKDWFIKDADLPAERLDALLRSAVQQHRIAETLNELLPTHPQYAALKNALKLSSAEDAAKINRIKLNMERWRWLPRDLGERYVIVNVPGYYVTLVEDGQTRWKQRAVAGAVRTPTPQISAMASGVILNPWWEVPKSIEPEVRGKAGYVAVKGKDGKVQRWRQPPGPSNALGQAKFVMPNSEAIFLHDTNARSKFNSEVRAFSHGCIRTQNILELAAELGSDDGGEWTSEKIKETLATKKTVEAKFVKPLPVYIVYFSSAALNDGRIIDYNDMYGRDGKVLAALQTPRGTGPKTEVATR